MEIMGDYVYVSDPGHGWLKVPKQELKDLGIQRKITSYSYTDGEFVYLEEDLDAETFLKAKFGRNNLSKQQFYRRVPNEYHENAPCRNYKNYKP